MIKSAALACLIALAPPSAGFAADPKVVSVAGSWEPTAVQTAAAREALGKYLVADMVESLWADNTPESPGEVRLRHGLGGKVGDYWLRVSGINGVQDELAAKIDGKKIIRLDGFCKVSGDSWKDAHYMVSEGGGDCFFHAEYDPDAKAIVFFEVNRP